MKKRTQSIAEAIEYRKNREAMIVKEVEEIKRHGKMKIVFLIQNWIRKELEFGYYCLNDLSEIARKAFRLSKRQTIDLVYAELESNNEFEII